MARQTVLPRRAQAVAGALSTRGAALGFAVLSCAYLALFVWLEQRRPLGGLRQVAAAVPVLLSLTAAGWVARFARWQWLLRRAGHRPRLALSLPSYLAGFAFTATPGKVGELVRIRYFLALGVGAPQVLSAFVFERACDLLVVLALAAIAMHGSPLFAPVAAFVVSLTLALGFLAVHPRLLSAAALRLRAAGWPRCGRAMRFLRDGLAGARIWFNPVDLAVAAVCGAIAWGTTAFTLVYLLAQLGFALPLLEALGIYPLAMLVGAASMLPGGVGSTEAALIALLQLHDVPWDAGALIAAAVRLATLWFAIAAGFLALGWLEARALLGARAQARSTE
jgi:uncharacterized protein (TIRG00374 family)